MRGVSSWQFTYSANDLQVWVYTSLGVQRAGPINYSDADSAELVPVDRVHPASLAARSRARLCSVERSCVLGRLSKMSWGIALAALAGGALIATVVGWRYVWSLAVRVRRGEFDADGLDDVDILGAPPVSGDDPRRAGRGALGARRAVRRRHD